MAPGIGAYFRSSIDGKVAGHGAQIGPEISITLRIAIVPRRTYADFAIIFGSNECALHARREPQDRAESVLAPEPSARLGGLFG